jgi:hypothetical protein
MDVDMAAYTFMKTRLAVLLSGLLLCGYAGQQASLAGPAIDRVQAGKDTAWRGGYLLHVAKRDGATLEGIQIATTNTVITADSGTVSMGSLENTTDASSMTLTLNNFRAVKTSASGAMSVTTGTKASWVLHE